MRQKGARTLCARRTGFNSRTPGGVRQKPNDQRDQLYYVSIHAPQEGCDGGHLHHNVQQSEFQFTHPRRGATGTTSAAFNSSRMFQFTHPRRGATGFRHDAYTPKGVSIHAPQEGCDSTDLSSSRINGSFNSRTPGGVRHQTTYTMDRKYLFQFTHPRRGATLLGYAPRYAEYVSIHAPQEGCDSISR